MPCSSLLLVLPPTGTVRKILVVTPQGFVRQELKHPSDASFLAFQLLPEVLQACVRQVQPWAVLLPSCCPMVMSIPGAAAVGGLCRGQ